MCINNILIVLNYIIQRRDNINIEFIKGILLVNINDIDSNNYCEYYHELKEIINNLGIKKLIITMDNIKIENILKIQFICNNYNLINRNNGRVIVCTKMDNDLYHKLASLDIMTVNNELTALKLLEI